MRACVDIGGTKVSVCLNPAGGRELLARRSEPTARTGSPDAVARQVIRLVDQACVELGIVPSEVQQIAVAAPGPFLLNEGRVEMATPNICGGLAPAVPGEAGTLPNDWRTAPVEAPVRERFARVRVENDGIAALEAERRWGALQGVEHCAYVTWSTGVGCGLCVGGRVLQGKQGNAGHLGHSFVSDDSAARCGCGNVGDLEALVGGASIARRFGISAAALMGQAAAGEAQALARLDELCRVMGRALYNLAVMLDLQRISLGGSVFLHHQALLLPRLQAQLAGGLPAVTDGCGLVPAGVGGRGGEYGALALLD